MKTIPLDKLQTYNDLYDLGLDAAQIQNIRDSYQAFRKVFNAPEVKSSLSYRTVLIYDTKITFGKHKRKIAISHEGRSYGDNEPSIIMLSGGGLKDGEIRDSYYGLLRPGCLFNSDIPNIQIESLLSGTDVNTIWKMARTRGLHDTFFNSSKKPYIIPSVNAFKTLIREKLKNVNSVNRLLPEHDAEKQPTVTDIVAIEGIFGLSSAASTAYAAAQKEVSVPNDFVSKIVSVLEIPVTRERLALVISTRPKYRNYNNAEREAVWRYFVVDADHVLYNYVDRDRIVWYRSDTPPHVRRYNLHNESGKALGLPAITFLEDDPFLPTESRYLEEYATKQPRNRFPILLGDTDCQRLVAAAVREEKRANHVAARKQVRKKAIVDRMKNLDPAKSITINDLKIFNDRVEYDSQVFKASNVSVRNLLNTMLASLGEQRINFDNFLEAFLSSVCPEKQYNKRAGNPQVMDVTATIGDVDVHYESRSSKDSRGVEVVRHYVNDKRVNREEVLPIIRQAVCFNDTENYKGFIEQVSKCSLKVHGYLAKGFDFKLYDEFRELTIHVKLPVQRTRGKNYINLKDHPHQIKNINKLATRAKATKYGYGQMACSCTMNEFIEILGDESIVGITDFTIFKDLLAKAKNAYTEAVKKSKELLLSTEKVLGIQEESVQVAGRYRTGYVITGTSGKKYFVDSSDQGTDQFHNTAYPVFALPDGSPICIVDKANKTSQVGKDALVNRLFALKNDRYIAKEVTTLKV
jgi:hypothetical protein